jgi:hypothetical protein
MLAYCNGVYFAGNDRIIAQRFLPSFARRLLYFATKYDLHPSPEKISLSKAKKAP